MDQDIRGKIFFSLFLSFSTFLSFFFFPTYLHTPLPMRHLSYGNDNRYPLIFAYFYAIKFLHQNILSKNSHQKSIFPEYSQKNSIFFYMITENICINNALFFNEIYFLILRHIVRYFFRSLIF